MMILNSHHFASVIERMQSHLESLEDDGERETYRQSVSTTLSGVLSRRGRVLATSSTPLATSSSKTTLSTSSTSSSSAAKNAAATAPKAPWKPSKASLDGVTASIRRLVRRLVRKL